MFAVNACQIFQKKSNGCFSPEYMHVQFNFIHKYHFFLCYQYTLTTVLILLFPTVTLRRHLYSEGSGSGGRPGRGFGFVLPSSVKTVFVESL
jgi:hypothetical protein